VYKTNFCTAKVEAQQVWYKKLKHNKSAFRTKTKHKMVTS